MSDEAEKVISLSLCKMAETRTSRRGGTSLHKHVLISSVLTKARSAYFENCCTGLDVEAIEADPDVNCEAIEPSDSGFLDDSASIDQNVVLSDMEKCSSSNTLSLLDNDILSKSNLISLDPSIAPLCPYIDPRLFVDGELNMSLNTSDFFRPAEGLSPIVSSISNPTEPNGLFHNSNVNEIDESSNGIEHAVEQGTIISTCQRGAGIVYVDLDSAFNVERCSLPCSSANATHASTDGEITIEPIYSCKRRRRWSLEEDLEASSPASLCIVESNYDQAAKYDRPSGLLAANVAKRLRVSPPNDQCLHSSDRSDQNVIHPELATKDDDVVFEDDSSPSTEQCKSSPALNSKDRRVPTSSGSSSDEDDSSAMEVDQLTSLVQVISFGKSQSIEEKLRESISTPIIRWENGGSIETLGKTSKPSSSLVRSLSSPDLCSEPSKEVQLSRNTEISSSSSDFLSSTSSCGSSLFPNRSPVTLRV